MLFLIQTYPIIGLLSCLAIAILYATLASYEKRWLRIEISMGAIFLLLLPFSNRLCSIWLGGSEGDPLSRNLFSLLILGIITRGAAFYFTRHSEDRCVRASLAITNIVVSSHSATGVILMIDEILCLQSRVGLIAVAAHALFYVKGFHPLALQGDCTVGGVVLLGDLVNLQKLWTNKGQLKISGIPKYCAFVDAIGSLIVAFILIAFPGTTAIFLAGPIEVTGVHVKLLRNFGFEMAAMSTASIGCLYYKLPKDVASVLRAKLALYTPVVFASLVYYMTSQAGMTRAACILMGVGAVTLTFICLIAQQNQDSAVGRKRKD